MIYKKRSGPKGRPIFFKDGKLTSVKFIPDEIIKQLELRDEIDATPKAVGKDCLFCGKPATKERLVNGLTVVLCDFDYYDKSVGKIAERMRMQNETQKEIQKKEEVLDALSNDKTT